MIDSTPAASGAVVDQARLGRPSRWLRLMQAARQRKRCEDALTQTRHGARPVAFQGEQVLAGPEDRLDALADGRQVRPASGLVHARGAHDGTPRSAAPAANSRPA